MILTNLFNSDRMLDTTVGGKYYNVTGITPDLRGKDQIWYPEDKQLAYAAHLKKPMIQQDWFFDYAALKPEERIQINKWDVIPAIRLSKNSMVDSITFINLKAGEVEECDLFDTHHFEDLVIKVGVWDGLDENDLVPSSVADFNATRDESIVVEPKSLKTVVGGGLCKGAYGRYVMQKSGFIGFQILNGNVYDSCLVIIANVIDNNHDYKCICNTPPCDTAYPEPECVPMPMPFEE